jgi:predicted house-cleaning noncanonical NTP pyrophosphatase (MazG superfamily)
MDIRSAQKIAWDTKLVTSTSTNDVSVGFGLLSDEVAKAFDVWNKGHREIAEELAIITVFLLRLAEMAGTDLQTVVEAQLAVTDPEIYRRSPDRVPIKDGSGATTAAVNRGKLVRDKIPQIIRSKGQEPVIYKADTEEYSARLRDKLREEVEEYLASDNDHEELADILEVLYALASQTGTDQQQLEKLRAAKAEERGGFADRIVWFRNQNEVPAQDARHTAGKL